MATYEDTLIRCPDKKGKCARLLKKQYWGGKDWKLVCLECGFTETVSEEKLMQYETKGEIIND